MKLRANDLLASPCKDARFALVLEYTVRKPLWGALVGALPLWRPGAESRSSASRRPGGGANRKTKQAPE